MYRHKTDPSSLVAGILFFNFALRYLIDGFGGDAVSYSLAIPTALAGMAVIVLLRLMFRRRRREP